MAGDRDTYHRTVQIGASRRRLEDAEALKEKGRWTGAMYLGGYAVECAFVALICYNERTTNFKETKAWQSGIQGGTIHRLAKLWEHAAPWIQRQIAMDATGKLLVAWQRVSAGWQYEKLRYHDKVGEKAEAEDFISAVRTIHNFLLRQQGE